jgi:polysaccharide biosynthesis transport protein
MNQNFPSHATEKEHDARRPPQPHGYDEDVIDIGALVGSLWRGKWIILLTTLFTATIGVLYAYKLATPIYQSTAAVMLDTRESQVVDLESVMGGLSADATALNSEVEVLKSRGLLGKVVDKLDLVEDPEFNPNLQDASLIDVLKSGVKQVLSSMIGGSDAGPLALSPEELTQRVRNSTIDVLLGALRIHNLPMTLVFNVTASSESPRKAALIADTLVDLYIRNQLEVKFDATEQATSWLSERVSTLQGELEKAEAKVKSFNSGTDLINQETLQALERQLKEMRDRISSAKVSQTTIEDRLVQLKSAGTPAQKAAAAGDAQLQRMLSQIGDPGISAAFEVRFQQQLERAELDANRGAAQLEALRKSEAELASQIDKQSADLITLQQLTREADANRTLYDYFLGRLKETSAQQGIQQADSRSLSQAVIARNPSEPKKSMIVAVAGLLGFLIGAIMVLVREIRNNTYRLASELEQDTGYAVMGQIPLLPSRRRNDAISYLADKPTSVAAEAIRNLRTSLLLSNVDTPPQIIATSSSLPGEGKTTLALALAQNLIGLGKSVLLIEGDIRRQVFQQYLTPEERFGLISVLTGEKSLSEAVTRDDRIGADILVGQTTSTNAADIFSSESFRRLLETARASYDMIIIDTPPVLIVPDARVIAQHIDAMLFVVNWDSTLKPQVAEALHMFESVNRPVSGLVLNQIDPKGMKRYGKNYGAYAGYGYGKKYYVN